MEPENVLENIPRMPMRKPMSMVQHWVNTGEQPYLIHFKNQNESESGSSLVEEDLPNVVKVLKQPCQFTTSALEDQSKTNDFNENSRFILENSSNSSIDTAAYILANNNTTKKADTIAIVEGSKSSEKNHVDTAQVSKSSSMTKKKVSNKNINTIIERIKIINNQTLEKKSHHSMLNNSRNDTDTVNEEVEKIDNLEKNTSGRLTTINETTLELPIRESSDESIINTKIENGLQRKKLYNCTESLAEFTPVSEENLSHVKRRLTFRKSDHPALETPRHSLRSPKFSKHRFKLKNNKQKHLLSSAKLSIVNKNNTSHSDHENDKSSGGSKSQSKNSLQHKDKAKIKVNEKCENNNKSVKNNNKSINAETDNDSDNSINRIQEGKAQPNESSVDDNSFTPKQVKLKTEMISLSKLPHRYTNSFVKINSDAVNIFYNDNNKLKKGKSDVHVERNTMSTQSANSSLTENKTFNVSQFAFLDGEDNFIYLMDNLFKKTNRKTDDCKIDMKNNLNIKGNVSNSEAPNSVESIQDKNNFENNTRNPVDNKSCRSTEGTSDYLNKNSLNEITSNEFKKIAKKNKTMKNCSKFVLISSSDESELRPSMSQMLKKKSKRNTKSSMMSTKQTNYKKNKENINHNENSTLSDEVSDSVNKQKFSIQCSNPKISEASFSTLCSSEHKLQLPDENDDLKLSYQKQKISGSSSDEEKLEPIINSAQVNTKNSNKFNTQKAHDNKKKAKFENNKLTTQSKRNHKIISLPQRKRSFEELSSDEHKSSIEKHNKKRTDSNLQELRLSNENVNTSNKSRESSDEELFFPFQSKKNLASVTGNRDKTDTKLTVLKKRLESRKLRKVHTTNKPKSNRDNVKYNKSTKRKSEKNNFSIHISSDDECIVPLK